MLTAAPYRESTPEEAAETPLEQISEDPVRFELVHNHMVKMFALDADEMTDGAMTPMVFTTFRRQIATDNALDTEAT
jgi:hypothetical protein